MKATFHRIDLSEEDIAQALTESKAVLPPALFKTIEAVAQAYLTVVQILNVKDITLARLRKMVFGPTGEKSRQVLPPAEVPANGKKPKASRAPLPGHGRNGQADYPTAKTEKVLHHRLASGDHCPGCRKGKVYDQQDRPGILVRVMGQPPLAATVYHLQKLRCNLCGEIFEARPPADVGRRKYDESAASIIALFKYGGGFPWNRLGKLQGCLGIPLPPSTQWEIVQSAAQSLLPVLEELQRQAAQGRVLHNDDTAMKILERMGKRRQHALLKAAENTADLDPGKAPAPGRTGVFTSGIVSQVQEHKIALFFTGVKHAGENLHALLLKRGRGLRPPIQMCDALSRNFPKPLKTILANCLAHGRRQFVELVGTFPTECATILRVLARVYKNDAIAKKRKLTDTERLRFHQAASGPRMEQLHVWMQAQFAEKKVEPNSSLGQAIGYMLKHWEALTLFLNKAGAPLDNNICERALKKAILHRKNSLFYKTDNGARSGDLYMSLIHTCDLNGVDPFDYLTQLQRHAKEVRTHPGQWLPWTYHRVLSRLPPGRADPPPN
jgi:transposase